MVNRSTYGYLDAIHTRASDKLVSARDRTAELLTQTSGTPTGDFMEKFLEMRETNSQLLWEMFAFPGTIPTDDINILDSFNSFVANCLLDDSGFLIEWRKIDYGPNFEIIWEPGGSYRTVVTTKNDPDGRPHVLWSNADHSTQNARLLIEAMNIVLTRDRMRTEKCEQDMEFIKEATAKIRKG